MNESGQSTGGIRAATVGFGRADEGPTTPLAADPPFVLWVIGRFGQGGSGRVMAVQGADLDAVLAGAPVEIAFDCENHMGSAAPAIAVRIRPTRFREFDPGRAATLIPELLRPAAPSRPTTGVESGSLDRLLDLVDIPGADRPDAAPERQRQAIFGHPAWLSVESAWRALRLLARLAAAAPQVRLSMVDLEPADVEARLPDLVAAAPDGAQPDLVLLLDPFDGTDRDLRRLAGTAEAAEAAGTLLLGSLSAEVFRGRTPADVARLDRPAALLEEPGWEALHGLEGKTAASGLALAWNDLVLREPDGSGAPLWGGAAVVVAGLILRSLVKTGWPASILAPATLDDLPIVEMRLGGRRVAIPLRAATAASTAADFATAGIVVPVAVPDRDQVVLATAPMLAAAGRRSARPAADEADLRFQLAYRRFARLLAAQMPTLDRSVEPAAVAEQVAAVADGIARTTGPGGAGRLESVSRSDADRTLVSLSIRFGPLAVDGAEFGMDVEV